MVRLVDRLPSQPNAAGCSGMATVSPACVDEEGGHEVAEDSYPQRLRGCDDIWACTIALIRRADHVTADDATFRREVRAILDARDEVSAERSTPVEG